MTHSQHLPLITILGPTASGKTKLAVSLAKEFSGEIISADSRQVYRHMDIGTGKDLREYGTTPYHLIDIVNPNQEYNLFQFAQGFLSCFQRITDQKTIPFLVGGTGMYLDSVLSRYALTIANTSQNAREQYEKKCKTELIAILGKLKPELHNQTDLIDTDRIIQAIIVAEAEHEKRSTLEWPEMDNLIIGLKLSRDERRARITSRLKARIEEGLIEEIAFLHEQYLSWEQLDNFGLEYRYVSQYVRGNINLNDMYQKLNSAIHRFAKQQEKWFRNIEKKGHKIEWVDCSVDPKSAAKCLIEKYLQNIRP